MNLSVPQAELECHSNSPLCPVPLEPGNETQLGVDSKECTQFENSKTMAVVF